MILLLGGTTEATAIAHALADDGREVLLSTATSLPVCGGLCPGIRLRQGELDANGLVNLIRAQRVGLLVDATHPYAEAVSANGLLACRRTGTAYVAYDRPGAVADGPDADWAADHVRAAAVACSFGRPVLLTIGVRNLAAYVAAARLHRVEVLARVLDHPTSIEACRRAGLDRQEIVPAKGPFTVAENAALIRRHHIGVLVTKDSGEAGGVGSKVAAARDCGCRVVVVQRPPRPQPAYQSVAEVIEAVRSLVASDPDA